ncbi:MAG: hypothetical protein ABW046_22535 [Actinoplanes sp.]
MAFGDADASTPPFVKANVAGKNATTASFTPPAGALLVAFAWHDTAGGNLTNTSVVTDSQGLTWTIWATRSKQSDGAGAANSHVQVNTAVVASSTAMTVTTTGTNTNNPAGLYCLVLTGADTTTPMDVTPVEGTTNSAAVSTSITTVTDGARCYLVSIDWNVAAAPSAGTGQTGIVIDTIGSFPDDRIYLGVTNAVTSPAGSTTLSVATPTTGNTTNWIGIAIRPAAGGATNLNVGSAAATVAAANVGLALSAAAGSGAVAAAGQPVTLNARPSAGSVTATAAGQPVTLALSAAAGGAAVGVGASNITVTSGSTLQVGAAAAGVAAANVGLTVGALSGQAAVGVGAAGVVLSSTRSTGFAPVSVGASNITLTASGATSLPVGNAMIAVGAFDIRLEGGDIVTTPTGSWYGLLGILQEIRQTVAEELALPPVACWRCGEPLYSADNTLRCRFCGWTPPEQTL